MAPTTTPTPTPSLVKTSLKRGPIFVLVQMHWNFWGSFHSAELDTFCYKPYFDEAYYFILTVVN